jgi:hypothetical protein
MKVCCCCRSEQIDVALSDLPWPPSTRFTVSYLFPPLLFAPRSEEGKCDTDVQRFGLWTALPEHLTSVAFTNPVVRKLHKQHESFEHESLFRRKADGVGVELAARDALTKGTVLIVCCGEYYVSASCI